MAAVSLAGLFAFHPKTSYADAPSFSRVNFQGKVVNADGTNVTNGNYNFDFILWDDPTAGTNRWQELSKSITVTNGVFQTDLGSATALPDFSLYNDLYLAIRFNGDAQGYMTPRIRLTGVPYAMDADKLDGKDASAFGQLSATNAWTNTNSIQIASATAFQIQNSTGDSLFTADTTNDALLVKNQTELTFCQNVSCTNSGKIYRAADGTFNIYQTDNTKRLNIQTANLLVQDTANAWTGVFSISNGGRAAFSNSVDSATAFQVQNSGGGGILTVDTSGGQVLLGTLGGSGMNGTLVFNSATAGNYAVTLATTNSQAASYTLNFPTATPATGKCLQTSAGDATQLTFDNCGSGGSGVTTVGAFSGSSQTNGASIAGSTITFGPADMTNPGMVSTTSQTFTGNKTFKSTTNSTTAFQIQNAAGATVFNVDTTDTQLITTNPGFEANPLTGWSGLTAGTVARDTTQAYIGFASGKVTAGTSAGGGISYTTTLSTNTQYTLSFYAKLDSASAALTTLQAGYNGNSSEVDCTWQGTTSTNATVLSTGWQRYVCTFTTPASTSGSPYIYVEHNDTTSEVFYVDAVQLETGAVATPYGAGTISLNATLSSPTIFMNQSDSSTEFQVKTAGSLNLLTIDSSSKNQNNLVTNPSAEVGLTASGTWSARGSSTVTQSQDFAYNGANSVKAVTTAAANDGVKYTTGASFLTNGTTYTLLAYVKTSSTLATNTFEIGHADDGTTPTDVSCLTAQVLTQGWTKFTCTWTSGTITGSPYIYFKQTDAPTGGRTFYVDAVLLQTDANSDSNYRDGKINFGNSVFNNPIIFQNAQNSSTALQIQNASGTQIFNVDTTDTNLISNPGFETNITGWTASGTGSIRRETAQTYLGIASLKVISQAIASNGAQFSLNPIVTKASTTYTISFYGRFDSGSTTPTLNIRYSPDGSATSDCSVTAINLTAMVSTGWTRYYCAVSSATAPTTSGYIRIMQTDAITHTYYIDAVQMEETTVANMTAYGAGTISWNGIIATPAIFKNIANSTTAFQVQNVAGINFINVDTLGSIIGVGNGALATTVNIGNTTGTTAVSILCGTGICGIGNSATTHATTVGSTLSTSATTLQGGIVTTTNNQAGVIVGGGYSSSDTSLVPLRLDSTVTLTETASTCSGTVNGGAMYYNSNAGSNAIRACINGVWEDLPSTNGLGLMAFGVVANSGSNPGDLASLVTAQTTGPCKVYWASTTTVTVAPCVAYSGGRKVVVSSTTLTLTTTTTNLYENVCLTGTNSAPALVGPAATQTSATIMPTFSASKPILCLATLRNSSTVNGNFTGSFQGQIYDVRTFTDTLKQHAVTASALGLGYIAQASGSGVTVTTNTVGTQGQSGVIVASDGSTSATNPDVIIAHAGPSEVVATAGTAGQWVVVGGTTASFAATTTTTTYGPYAYLGTTSTTFAAGCTSASTCIGSLFTELSLR